MLYNKLQLTLTTDILLAWSMISVVKNDKCMFCVWLGHQIIVSLTLTTDILLAWSMISVVKNDKCMFCVWLGHQIIVSVAT